MTKAMTIKFDEDQFAKIKSLAEKEKRPFAAMVRVLCERALTEESE